MAMHIRTKRIAIAGSKTIRTSWEKTLSGSHFSTPQAWGTYSPFFSIKHHGSFICGWNRWLNIGRKSAFRYYLRFSELNWKCLTDLKTILDQEQYWNGKNKKLIKNAHSQFLQNSYWSLADIKFSIF